MNKYLKQLVFPITTWFKNRSTPLEIKVVFIISSLFLVWPLTLLPRIPRRARCCWRCGARGGDEWPALGGRERTASPHPGDGLIGGGGQLDPSVVRGRLWCCYSKCDTVGWGWGGRVQDQEAEGVSKGCSGAHPLAYVCHFSPSVLPLLVKLMLCMYMCQQLKRAPTCQSASWMFDLKTKQKQK